MLAAMHPLQTNEFVTRASVLPSPIVLRHATCNAAQLVGLEKELGTISTVGAFADILIVKVRQVTDSYAVERPRIDLGFWRN